MPKVTVKWGGEKLDVEADLEQEPLVFKSQLFGLTGVPPDRQKVMFKGRTIKDDTWNGVKLESNSVLMMLGSATALPQQQPQSADASAINVDAKHGENDDDAEKQVRLPPGLQNLGNTCYMNATLQSFLVIPELVNGISKWTSSGSTKAASDTMKAYTGSIHTLFQSLKAGDKESYTPLLQLTLMHRLYPQFAMRGEQGGWQQQDANECFSSLLHEFSNASEVDIDDAKKIPVRKFIEGQYEIKLKNTESEEEEVQTSYEDFMQLSCYLAQETRYMQSGIKSKLTEEITKFSSVLNKDCVYKKETLISRLPAYVTIQMVRFFYKEKDQINAKILKDVKFPMILDLIECCTPELKAKLRPSRNAFKEYDDKMLEQQRAAKLNDTELPKEKKPDKFAPTSFEDDPGSSNSGFYELKAVITHKGRSSNSGHYVAWVRIQDDKWAMCDDEDVYLTDEQQILKLSGGGDHHCAYVFVYGPRRLPILDA